MAILPGSNTRTYLDIEANVDISVSMPLFRADTIAVFYGDVGLTATQNVDYEIILNEADYSDFTFRPLDSLLDKIDARIAANPTEHNTVQIVRTLPLSTDSTPGSARSSEFVSKEFDRITMKFQQVDAASLPIIIELAARAEVAAETAEVDAATSVGAAADAVAAASSTLMELDSRAYAIASYHPAAAPNKIRVAGYASPGDGGGALYFKVASQPSHAGKFSITLANASVVWYEMVRDDIVDLRAFGGVADYNGATGTDNWQAIEDAIGFLGAQGGKIRIVGQFYKSNTNVVEKHVGFIGGGTSILGVSAGKPSIIWVPAGKTAFIYQAGTTLKPASTVALDGVEVQAKGKNATTTTGSIATGAARTLTLAAAQDFETGQIISVRGAGRANTLGESTYVKGYTTAGSTTFVTAGPDAVAASLGVVIGMTVQVAGAGLPAGTYVVSGTNGTYVLSNAAANTVNGGVITFYDDLRAQILSGGGTTTLIVSDRADTSVTGAVVEHYDCGVFAFRTIAFDDWGAWGFSGAGICLAGGSTMATQNGQVANVNSSYIGRGSAQLCRNGIVLIGFDGNIVEVHGANCLQNTGYDFIDCSFLGCSWFACHSASKGGYMTTYVNALSMFVGCYVEDGTACTFAARTTVLGGFLSGTARKWGCVYIGGDYQNGGVIVPKLIAGTDFNLGYKVSLSANFLNAIGVDGTQQGAPTNNVYFARSITGEGQEGLWGWRTTTSAASLAGGTSDANHPYGAGWAHFSTGILMGRGSANLGTTFVRKRQGTVGAPSSGSVIRGDWFEEFNVSPAGNMFHVCTTAGVIGSTAVIKTGGVIAP